MMAQRRGPLPDPLGATGDDVIDNLLAMSRKASGERRSTIAGHLAGHFAQLVRRAEAGDAAVALMHECAGGLDLLDTLEHAIDARLEACAEREEARREGQHAGTLFRLAELHHDAFVRIAIAAGVDLRVTNDLGSEDTRAHYDAIEEIVAGVETQRSDEDALRAGVIAADKRADEAELDRDRTIDFAIDVLEHLGPESLDESIEVYNLRRAAERIEE